MSQNNKELAYNDVLSKLLTWNPENKNKKNIQVTFQVTEDCTLRCTYCYQHNKSHKVMSIDTAKKFIDVMFEQLPDKYYAVIIDLIGGEPLMYPNLLSEIVDYWDYQCIMHYPDVKWGLYTRFSICSNGTEWDRPDVQNLINKIGNRLSFTVSIDGNKELHDSARLLPDGSGSYDKAIHAATDYEQRYNQVIGSKMTIAPANIIFTYPAIKHYLDNGKQTIFANCVYEEGWTNEHATILYEQLKKVADYKIEHYPDVYLSIFEEDFFMPMDEEDNQNWCGGTGSMLACDPDGILYPCLRYMPSSVGRDRESSVTCGDLDHGIDFVKLDVMGVVTRRSQSTDECFYCPIAKGCSWCSAYNWESQGSYNKRATYICPMHKARALANVYYWNTYYRKYNINKRKTNYCPKEWALEIIDEKEYNMLEELSKF